MRRGWVLALASLTIVLVVVDLTAVTIALPDIRAALRAAQIGSVYPEGPARGRALGIFSAVSGLAMTLGPVVGGALTATFGWRAIFLINLPIGVFVVVALRQRVPESRGRGHLDPLGVVLVAAALFAIIPALIHDVPLLLVAGLALLAAFVLAERRTATPMIDFGLFRNRVFAVGSATTLLMLAALLGGFTYLTLYVQGPLEASPSEAGVRFLAFSVAAVIGPIAVGRVLHRWPMGVLIAAGPALITVALLVMAIPAADRWTPIMAGLFLGGLGLCAGNVVANQVGLTAPMDQVGMATGTVNTLKQVGTAVGVAVLAAPYRSG
ncbi:MFS transporter [Nonomuraea sp. NPDC049637]|uniref:MFS transporter n=1 Tax=Nonomuraea sp. NPDC049637 TaxID=3154356 RepID=UPI003428D5FD